jgi:hypothetical protein
LGATTSVVRTVPLNDWRKFQSTVEQVVAGAAYREGSAGAREFAAQNLDLEQTSDKLVKEVEQLMARQ